MGLVHGEIKKELYSGTGVCDKCGFTEPVTAKGEKINGTKPWRHVGFKYRPWIACSNSCERELNEIAARELAKDKVPPGQKKPIQMRPNPIEGTYEAVVAADRSSVAAPA